MTIYLGADHAGFELKEHIKKILTNQSQEVEDFGHRHLDLNDDYPDFALLVAQKVAETESGGLPRAQSRGLLFCASGAGMCIAANKVKGIRAVSTTNPDIAKHSRQDDDTNILCLPAKFITSQQAEKIISIWLNTEFKDEERYRRRVEKIERMEPPRRDNS